MIKLCVLVFITLWVTVSITVAQTQVFISGLVLDSSSDQPIPFVTIQIKNKTGAQSSNEDGHFSIHAQVNDTLVFTRLGYLPYSFGVVNGNKNLTIRLIENAFLLNEAIIYNSFQPYGSEKWNSGMKPTKVVTFKATPSFEPGVIIRFGGKKNTKGREVRKTIVYDSTVNSDVVKKHLMDLYSISEETYYRKLEEFNKKNSDVAFLTKQDEIILRLIQFFALREP